MSEFNIFNYTCDCDEYFEDLSEANTYIKYHPNDKLVLYELCRENKTELYSQDGQHSTRPDFGNDDVKYSEKRLLDKDRVWFAFYTYFPSWMDGRMRYEFMTELYEAMEGVLDDSVRVIFLEKNTDEDSLWREIHCIYSPSEFKEGKYDKFFEEANKYIEEFNRKYAGEDEE